MKVDLISNLKLTTESAIKDKATLEQQLEDLQSILRNSDLNKKELCQQIDLLQNQLEQLESKVQAQNYQLAQTNQDLNEQKSTSTQIRILAEDSERALDELKRQLAIKNDELHNIEQANFRLEAKLSKLNIVVEVQFIKNFYKNSKETLKFFFSFFQKKIFQVKLKFFLSI